MSGISFAPKMIFRRLFSYLKVNSEEPIEQREVETENLVEKQSRQNSSLEEEQLEETTHHRAVLPGRIIAFASVVTLGILIFAAFGLYHHASQPSTSAKIASSTTTTTTNFCGNSSAEASSRGCTFDQLTWSWLPPHCRHYANDLFLSAADPPGQPWRYYADIHDREPVRIGSETWTKALDNRIGLWTENSEHLTHCVYLFLGVGQIVRDGGRFVPVQVQYGHLEHCKDMILGALRESPTWASKNTHAGTVLYDQDC
jgi:hypothetical protein